VSFTVTVLGSSGMYATRQRACSGYLLEIEGKHVWLDAGAGTWRNLLESIDYPDIDAVILTHEHPDHTTDVFQAFHARNYGTDTPMPSIPLWAPKPTVDRLRAFDSSMDESFDMTAIVAEGAIEFAGAKFSFTKMAHPVETLGVRVEAGDAILAYSADSGTGADFDALASGASLFICEATFQDSDESWTGHMSAAEAATIAGRVDATDLLLTHLPPGRDLALSLAEADREGMGLRIQLAADGQRLEVGP
jgi:ribonuclease BN (tRNA processing enzyme)